MRFNGSISKTIKLGSQFWIIWGNNSFWSVQILSVAEVRWKSSCICFLMDLQLCGSRRKHRKVRGLGLGKGLLWGCLVFFFFFVKIPFFKENLAVVCMLPVQWDMQVAAGHCRSSCLLEQVLDYKGKLRNLLKYFYLALFMQPHEDLSPLLSSGVQVVALWSPKCPSLELPA